MPIKVLQLGPLYNNHLRRWSGHAAALGCQVHAAGHVRPGRRPIDLSGLAERVDFLPARLYDAEPADQLAWLSGVLDEVQPDLIHAHWLARWGHLAALSGHERVVATGWGCDLYNPTDDERPRSRAALCGAHALIARSEHMRRAMIDHGASAGRIHRIDLGVDLRRFRLASPAARARLRERLELPPGPLVLSFRADDGVYNLALVLEPFAVLRRRIPEANLVLVHGDKPLSERLSALAARCGVLVRGHVPHGEMAGYMRAADVGISVPSSDGSPSSVWEALASGLPLVLSDLPQVREKVGDCEAAAFVEPEPEPVAEALAAMLDVPEAVRASAREWAEANADERVQRGRLGALYAAMAGSAAGSPTSSA